MKMTKSQRVSFAFLPKKKKGERKYCLIKLREGRMNNFFFLQLLATVHSYRWPCTVAMKLKFLSLAPRNLLCRIGNIAFQHYNCDALTTYYSSKLINKTNVLFSLSHLLLKKIFFFSISFFSFFSLWSVVSPSQLLFPHLLLSFLLLSSWPFLSSSFFFFFFSSLFLSSVQCCFSLLLLFLLSSHWFSFIFTGGSWWWMLVDRG